MSVAAWAEFVEATGYRSIAEVEGSGFVDDRLLPGACWSAPGGPGSTVVDATTEPVTQIAWLDAVAWCDWRNAVDPGARLATEAEWAVAAQSEGAIAAAADRRSVHEWVADWFSPTFHRSEQRVNPTGPTAGTHRVVRTVDRVTARQGLLADTSAIDLGFRPVRTSPAG